MNIIDIIYIYYILYIMEIHVLELKNCRLLQRIVGCIKLEPGISGNGQLPVAVMTPGNEDVTVVIRNHLSHSHPILIPFSSHAHPILIPFPICSMYGIYGRFTNIYPINHPHVGKYTIHGAFGFSSYSDPILICVFSPHGAQIFVKSSAGPRSSTDPLVFVLLGNL